MDVTPQSLAHCSNLLLSRLPDSDNRAMIPHLECILTPLHFVLCRRNKPIHYAYFPLTAAHSIKTAMGNGAQVEVAVVGFEGLSTVDLITDSLRKPSYAKFQVKLCACRRRYLGS
jgi:hypothetical protein